VEQDDLDELDEEAPCVVLRNMSIGDVCPKESEEPTQAQDQPSSSMQASPPTQDEDQAQDDENEDQEDEPPQEEDNDQGGDEDNEDKEHDQEIQGQRPPHPRVHQAIQRDHPVNSILGDIHKGVTTRSRVAHFCEHYSFVSSIEPYRVADALRDLDLDTGGKSVDQKVYRSMIGCLLYLCASRPDIMLFVCMCARFQANPKEVHLRVVKRIMRYLVYTPMFGLWYPKGSTFDLIGYFDVDWAGCKIDRKSTSGTCQFLWRSLVSWASKKQNYVALSTAEAEYIAAGHCCAQLLWMRQTLRDYGYKLSKVPLLCDTESAIRMADNPVEHSRT
jgi:hypothetical protein